MYQLRKFEKMILSSTRSGSLQKDFSLLSILVSIVTWGFRVPGGARMQTALLMGVQKARVGDDALNLALRPSVLFGAISRSRI